MDEVRRVTEEKGPRGHKSRNSAEVNVKSLSDDDQWVRRMFTSDSK